MNAGRENIFGMFGNNSRSSNMLDKSGDGINVFNGAAETPQYLIKSKDIFDSDISDGDYMETAAPCLNVEMEFARNGTYDSSGENSQDGRMLARPTFVCMRFGQWGPKLQERMFKANKIDQIEIHRMKSIEGELKPLQVVTFKKCLLRSYKQDGDVIAFSFIFAIVNDTITMYDSTHKALGKVSSEYDFEAVFFGS